MLTQKTDTTIATYDSLHHAAFSGIVSPQQVVELDSSPDSIHTLQVATPDRHEGARMPFTIEQSDSVFALLLFCFLLFAHIYNGGYTFLKENVSLLLWPEKSKRIYSQITSKEILYNYFLIFQAVVLIAITVYDVFLEGDLVMRDGHKPFITILLFILLIGLFFGFKDIIYRFVGYLFDMKSSISFWRKIYIVGIEILGMLYFIPVLLLVYSPYYHLQIIIFMVILFLSVQILLFYQIIVFFIREKFNFLYLIAYLCTFEILPYIFLFLGLAYLYKNDVLNLLWH